MQATGNVLIPKEGEEPANYLKRAIKVVLLRNKKYIIKLLEQETKESQIVKVKSLDDVIEVIKLLLKFEGLRQVSDKAIMEMFMRGWEEVEKKVNRNFIPNMEAVEYIKNYTFDNIQGMTEELANDLRRELKMAFMNGEGLMKIKERVNKVFNVGENRAEMIARTETNRALNQGSLQGYMVADPTAKKWLHVTYDNRTSDICKALGKKYGTREDAIKLDEMFSVLVNDKLIEEQAPPFHPNERSRLMFKIEKVD